MRPLGLASFWQHMYLYCLRSYIFYTLEYLSYQYKILSSISVLFSRFDVDVPGGAVYKESSFTEAGKWFPYFSLSSEP